MQQILSERGSETPDITIIEGDILKVDIPQPDLIVTSPPYNMGIEYESYEDNKTVEEYYKNVKLWLERLYLISKDTTRLILNIPFSIGGDGLSSRNRVNNYAMYSNLAYHAGWKYRALIIWDKGHVTNFTAWGSWKSASAPYIKDAMEAILVLYKDTWNKGKGVSTISSKEFIDNVKGVWKITGEHPERVHHPAPFPYELPYRAIQTFSFLDDVVLDPFCGSGTTLVACALTGRKGIGIDIDPVYVEIAKKRIAELKK